MPADRASLHAREFWFCANARNHLLGRIRPAPGQEYERRFIPVLAK